MSEFKLIQRINKLINSDRGALTHAASLGIGDDAAVLDPAENSQLVVTMDTLVSGVHFPFDSQASDIGYKALAVNLSDLAAMGAEPCWFFLSLCLPSQDEPWLDQLSEGLAELASEHNVELAGGDLTSGPLTITITALGQIARGNALKRNGAKPGDLVVISGFPGLAALGLSQYENNETVDQHAWVALNRPQPRLELGKRLVGKASACIDISDGLAADLGHITRQSGVGAEVSLAKLPFTDAMSELGQENRWNMQLGGGDDYELCFTLPEELETELPDMARHSNIALSIIGRVTAKPTLLFRKQDGSEFQPQRHGYNHFP